MDADPMTTFPDALSVMIDLTLLSSAELEPAYHISGFISRLLLGASILTAGERSRSSLPAATRAPS